MNEKMVVVVVVAIKAFNFSSSLLLPPPHLCSFFSMCMSGGKRHFEFLSFCVGLSPDISPLLHPISLIIYLEIAHGTSKKKICLNSRGMFAL